MHQKLREATHLKALLELILPKKSESERIGSIKRLKFTIISGSGYF